MYISMSRNRSVGSVFSANEKDGPNDARAALATALGDPNQTAHCSYEKLQVNWIEKVEAE